MIKTAINYFKTHKNVLLITLLFLISGTTSIVLAATDVDTTLNQTINEAALSIDIVDGSGVTVGSPSVTFPAFSFSFDAGDSAAVLGTASEQIRISNPTTTEQWTVSIAAASGETQWENAGATSSYPFNNATPDNGQLSVDPNTSTTITPSSGCSATNISKGTADAFESGTTDSIDLLQSAAGADTLCFWDFTGIDLTQRIPASQEPDSYSIDMTISII